MTLCPVPLSQIPLEEFKQLCKSWFFRWGINNANTLYKNLIISWFIILPFILIIETGSFTLKTHPTRLVLLGLIFGLILPLVILIRLFLGWNYIFKRLMAEKIEYEESGWYDGQVWEKPIDWREKDILVAQYEVKPIITKISKLLIEITLFILIAFSFYRTFNTLI
tara:strand:- start:630 stop:1127 length:498 start_codon:yes stop_codon:yes gene_type:complete